MCKGGRNAFLKHGMEWCVQSSAWKDYGVFGKQQRADEAKIILVGRMEDGKSRDRLETGDPGRSLSQ